MKNNISFFLLFIAGFISCKQTEVIPTSYYQCNLSFPDSSSRHPQHTAYQSLLDDMTYNGVPGVLMSIQSAEQGTWLGASGMADIANQVPMQSCNISRAGSIAKLFTATCILMLAEEEKLSLDDPVSKYLPENILAPLENARQATIHQLLHHSSGIFNYIQNLKFQTASLNEFNKTWYPNELLSYAHTKKAYFEPGKDVRYSNTNYVLLGMIIEKVTGKHFSIVFKEKIIEPLHLSHTSFDSTTPIPIGLVRGYIDLYSDFHLIESTYYSGWDYYTADGGLISNPYDLAVFIRALYHHELISPTSLAQMQQWVTPSEKDNDFFPIEYGLGIFRIQTPYGYAVYHSGDAIGYYGITLYFPEKDIAISWQTNGNYGKIDKLISSKEAMIKIMDVVLK
ncbi:serine hydrolase domain-containing protein [Cytophagaceae bacterium DM2B3-1]|uniref:Serine hydrolase domain-containing protein n=1 Tax=Xanthocytophaga flava TaxID=3048013 RepID=A0ABT7CEP8_9BACT|nr:serine hydrolase domain-containing protein [Xanthocytophaga flavus]MDJ1468954.1 serine hydrolase domain-containing protein [Xanthocytophaga flavus]MDJ1492128.1 serine hydrolase domain-containing protein [Xanthocytophaga flavus]